MKKLLTILAIPLAISACTSKEPQISAAEAQARLNHLEQWDAQEYRKASIRDEDSYQTYRSRKLDALEDQKIELQNERIHYQNQRKARRDMIEDIGEMQMNEARAINKANENISKQKNIYFIR